MFYKFKNQEERKKFGGTAFIEIAYCKNKSKFKILNNLLKRKKFFGMMILYMSMWMIVMNFVNCMMIYLR